MQRQLMSELIAWKSRANRKPLLLRGARQTGKTWLLNEFASQQYRNVIRFDFMLEPSTRSLFDGDLDPKRIISQIELLRGQTVTPADTLIIFDEIQEAPRGITSLKYLTNSHPNTTSWQPVPIWASRSDAKTSHFPSAKSTSSPCVPWGLPSSFVPSTATRSPMPSLPQT